MLLRVIYSPGEQYLTLITRRLFPRHSKMCIQVPCKQEAREVQEERVSHYNNIDSIRKSQGKASMKFPECAFSFYHKFLLIPCNNLFCNFTLSSLFMSRCPSYRRNDEILLNVLPCLT